MIKLVSYRTSPDKSSALCLDIFILTQLGSFEIRDVLFVCDLLTLDALKGTSIFEAATFLRGCLALFEAKISKRTISDFG